MRLSGLVGSLGLLARLGLATPAVSVEEVEKNDLYSRQESVEGFDKGGPPSCHTPKNRACWGPGFDVNTDYEEKTPYTGITRKYYLEITEHDNWVGGDGAVKEKAMLINGNFPGPNLQANWGDWMEIKVTNKMRNNGTSLHWHGIRFLRNNVNDGANGVTECPLPPGASKVYRWRVEQYGTGWYHSHFSSQYGNGVTGSLTFYGPASANYDTDLGVFPISDWYWDPADTLFHIMISGWVDPNEEGSQPGDNPDSNNILFNGTHVNSRNNNGKYYRVKLQKGKKHRLRMINPSVDNSLIVSLVGHKMTVIQTDYVPIKPYTANEIFMSVGQRYDVIIEANQAVGNYWFNVTHQGLCGETKMPYPAAIFQYEGADSNALPTDKGTPPPALLCQDVTTYEPIVKRNIPKSEFTQTTNNTLVTNFTYVDWHGGQRILWQINMVDFNVSWEQPTLKYLAEGRTDFPQQYNALMVPEVNQWSFWILENLTPISHPMHLHGHDLYILGHSPPHEEPLAAPMIYFNDTTDTDKLQFTNPTRRDVAVMPAMGWVAVAFRTDNPGVWLFHCHIAWHAGQGLAVQVVERVSEIPRTVNLRELDPVCEKWKKWQKTMPYPKIDSGVKRDISLLSEAPMDDLLVNRF